MADKLRTQQHLEFLQARHIGTGHADTTKNEWASNVKRDTSASLLGHPQMLQYYALATGLGIEKARMSLIDSMVEPNKPTPYRTCQPEEQQIGVFTDEQIEKATAWLETGKVPKPKKKGERTQHDVDGEEAEDEQMEEDTTLNEESTQGGQVNGLAGGGSGDSEG